jgi:3-methyladenine DNA glycosylase AlkD
MAPIVKETNERGKSSREMPVKNPFDRVAAITGFRRTFRSLGQPARAAGEKSYLKSPLRFHGVTVPDVRRTAAAFCKQHPSLSADELRALVVDLFATDYHDLRSLGIALLERKRTLLLPTDLPWCQQLVEAASNWAHVDWLATKVIGPLIAELPPTRRRTQLRTWAKDQHMWVRRTALLAQHDQLRAGGGDFDLFAEIATPMLGEKEFFIRKAIGWVLREVSHRRPELTFGFLRAHRGQLSGLTLREGARRLPSKLRDELM